MVADELFERVWPFWLEKILSNWRKPFRDSLFPNNWKNVWWICNKVDKIFQGVNQFPEFYFLTRSISHPLGDKIQSQILRRWRSEDNECLEVLKEFLYRQIFAWGLTILLVKKDFVKWDMALINFQMSLLACFSQATN